MSRIGPYASLLIALLLLIMAEIPRLVPGFLLMAGLSAERTKALAGDVGVGLAIIAAGFIVLSLVWLVRIARIEAAWMPYRDAMVSVAGPLGESVMVQFPRGMSFHTRVGSHDVQVFVDPSVDGRISFVSRMTPRQSFVVVRRGVELSGMPARWPMAGDGKTWELRSPRPSHIEWLARDSHSLAGLDRFFGKWKLRMMGIVPDGAEVIIDLVEPDDLRQAITRGFEAVSTLARINSMAEPKKKAPPIW